MAAKRRKHGDSPLDSPAEFVKSRGDTLGSSSAEFGKPIYLVAEQENEESAYSVIKIDAAAGGDKPLRARTVAGLPNTERGMSFVAAHSEHGSWIVGIGGRQRGFSIIFDPTTLETFRGPAIVFPQDEPVLISHGGEVYVISRRPQVVPYLDLEPWFQSLSFNNGVPSIDSGDIPCWSFPPPPPFFPCLLDPYEFENPPKITVTSYVSVASHILLSPQPELEVGTYGFHVVEKTWDKVCDENLPFAGQAVPLGGSLFAACPVYNNPLTATASVFHMSLTTQNTTRLSIQEIRTVVSKETIPRPLFCPLGKGSFCSIRLPPLNPIHDKANRSKRVQIILTTIQTENTEAENTEASAIQVKEHIHTYKCKGQFGLMGSAMPVVAALSMDTEDIEMFEENNTKIASSQTTDSTIFDAPIICNRP